MPALSKTPVTTPPRFRVISGVLYARATEPSAYDIRVHNLGHGHTEATVLPRYSWHESEALSPSALDDFHMSQGNIWVDGAWVPSSESESDLLDKLAANRDRSTRRARTKVRRLCLDKGLRVMLTLTYQENILDRSRIVRDFDVFVKRIRRVCPDFQYVCVFERQKRGAWHAHIAVPRVLSHYLHKGKLVRSYDMLRSVWRSVIKGGGNVDVSRNRKLQRSARLLAAYLAKYIGKSMGDALEGNSYSASGKALPKPVHFVSVGDLSHASAELMQLLESDFNKAAHFHHALLDCGGVFVSLST